jgi:hypothetical protein
METLRVIKAIMVATVGGWAALIACDGVSFSACLSLRVRRARILERHDVPFH